LNVFTGAGTVAHKIDLLNTQQYLAMRREAFLNDKLPIPYDWQNKYIVNLTARRDGSSRFGPGKWFGNFGPIGAAWIFSKEKFCLEE
jgi:hypothetical protein